jgi:hypothetical protein
LGGNLETEGWNIAQNNLDVVFPYKGYFLLNQRRNSSMQRLTRIERLPKSHMKAVRLDNADIERLARFLDAIASILKQPGWNRTANMDLGIR